MTRTARPISRLTTAVSSSPSRSCTISVVIAVNAQVGVAGAGGDGRGQRRVGQLMARQPEEVGVDLVVALSRHYRSGGPRGPL